jgi:hypothetical protein
MVQALIWLLAAPMIGAIVARLAVWVQDIRAPLLIFPLLVGCGLGLLLAGLMRLGQVGHRTTIWGGAILAVIIAVTGQHYFSFLDFKAALVAKKPQALAMDDFQAMLPEVPTSFARFMQRQATLGRPVTSEFTFRGGAVWASWALDGLLMLFATLTVIYIACRAPYCCNCRSWYRTTRAGPLDAEQVRHMVDAASLPIDEPFGQVQYRIAHCVGGCGPSRLDLAFRRHGNSKVIEVWLSAAQREHVARVLDGMN